jgi:hypothetical protein
MAAVSLAKPQRELLIVTAWTLLVPTMLAALILGNGPFPALLVVAAPVYFLAANIIVDRCGSRPADSSAARTPAPAEPHVVRPALGSPGTPPASIPGAPALPDPQPLPASRRVA